MKNEEISQAKVKQRTSDFIFNIENSNSLLANLFVKRANFINGEMKDSFKQLPFLSIKIVFNSH